MTKVLLVLKMYLKRFSKFVMAFMDFILLVFTFHDAVIEHYIFKSISRGVNNSVLPIGTRVYLRSNLFKRQPIIASEENNTLHPYFLLISMKDIVPP